jgi:hypothetical protein
MKTFHCTHCQSLVFFENVTCLTCGSTLAYLPEQQLMAALRQEADGSWQGTEAGADDPTYRLCANYPTGICNWANPTAEPDALCPSCRLTRVIPNLAKPENQVAWAKLETAKRRMMYTLLGLGLKPAPKATEPQTGLAFEFLEDSTNGDASRVLTGHDNGVITVNIAEADDVKREKQRARQHEPYRTLLGHFRHEIGHYYWPLLVKDPDTLAACRALFGDESTDYAQAVKSHYRSSDEEDDSWTKSYISRYATMHPYEDWAETFAHYLHILDTLQTAESFGVGTRGVAGLTRRIGAHPARPDGSATFGQVIDHWLALSYALNQINRSMGHKDLYPFVLAAPVIRKMAFVDRLVHQ